MALVSVTGLKELDRKMRALEPAMQKKIIRKAARRAAKPVLDRARAFAPRRSGALERSLKIRALRRSRRRTAIGVQVSTDKGWFKGDEFYGAFVELGTKHIEAKKYLRDARDQSRGAVKEVWIKELRQILSELA